MFDYASREHAVSVLLDHPLGGGVKDSFVADGSRARRLRPLMDQQMRDNPDSFVEDLLLEQANDLLRTALGNRPCPAQPDQIHDVACYLPLVSTRVTLLGAMAKDS